VTGSSPVECTAPAYPPSAGWKLSSAASATILTCARETIRNDACRVVVGASSAVTVASLIAKNSRSRWLT